MSPLRSIHCAFVTTTVTLTGLTTALASPPPPFDLAAAIAHAHPGDTLRVPPGHYSGPVAVNKPLRLLADGRVVIEGTGEGNIVSITAPDATVKGFTLRRTGIDIDHPNAAVFVNAPRATIEGNHIEDALFGVYVDAGADSVIRGNDVRGKTDLPLPRRGDGIKLWYSNGARVENNTIRDCRDMVLWYSNRLVVRGNRVSHCRYGLHFMFAGNATVLDNDLRDNSVGIFLMYSKDLELNDNVVVHNRGPSGFALGLKDVDGVVCHDNVFADNRVGLHVDNSPARFDLTHTFARNVFAYNDVALGLMPSTRNNRFTENTFFDNIEQVAVFGGGNIRGNEFSVDGRGNYWSDYRGYDADGNGVGDVAYRSQSVFENLMDRDPRMRMFLFSPAQQAVDLASRAFPVVKPITRATDPAPLMDPARREAAAVAGRPSGGGTGAALAAAGLLACGGTVVAAARRELGK